MTTSPPVDSPHVDSAPKDAGAGVERTVLGSCPLDCPDGCSWVVTVSPEGAATRLRGNPDHPFTAGGLCKKVNPWLKMAEDPSRLLQPMRRIAPKGHASADRFDDFEPISWDDAMAQIADRFNTIIASSGPAAIWPFAGTGNVGFVQGGALPVGSRLWNHLGVSKHFLTICSVSGHVGLSYSVGTGTGMDPEDVVHAGSVLIWGSNTLVANQHWWPFVERAGDAGAPIVVIDPIRTRTAARADLHIAPRPGTDGALALGLCRALIEADAVDLDFVETYTAGYDEFSRSLDEWSPERVSEVCGVPIQQLDELVDLLRNPNRRPLAVKLGQGMQRHAYGGQTSRIISCLPALTGSYPMDGRPPGGGLVYSTHAPYKMNTQLASGRHLGERPRALAMTNLAANLLELQDPPVEALFVHGANPVVSNPDVERVREGLSRSDLFCVVAEIYLTETTDYADIVLPSTMQHEQWEVNDSFAHMYLNLNQPAVEPPGQCLAHTEMFRRLAHAMDLDEPELFASDEELVAALIDTDEYRAAGVTLESWKETGWVRAPAAGSPYQPFNDGFPTGSGRFEFASERAENEGHGRLPNYRPPAEAASGDADAYDLVAIGSDWHINSVFAGTQVVTQRTEAPSISLHPDDARRDGIADGDRITVFNDRGSFDAVATVDERARPGVAATTKGWWGMGLNNTVAERDSDMGRGAVFHDNRVQIRPVM